MSSTPRKNRQDTKFIFEELEERRLFSGGIEGLIDTDLDANAVYADVDGYQADGSNSDDTSAAERQSQEVVFVDAGVDDYQQLVDDLQNNADSDRNIEVVVLDRDRDGIEEISEYLSTREDLDAVHIIAHGDDGSVQLGNTELNANTLQQNNLKIALWANSFSETGDILIYGCNLAETEAGQSLISDLSSLTLTDVAASTDATGHESLGGDWDLEYQAGEIEAELAPGAELQARYEYILAVINGTAGDDVLLGTAGNDTISADAGNDVLVGGGGSDQLLGEAGADVFRFTGAQDGDVYTVDGGSESDTIDLSEFGSGTVTDDGATITVDLGGGQSFTINYSNVENVVTADTAGNHGPEAIAQIREAYAEGDGITINGTLSDDFDGDALTYQWTQIGGPAVTLNNANTSAASFTAPSVASPTTFTFRLVVSDGTTSHVDTVETTVLPTTTGGFGADNMVGTSGDDYLIGMAGGDTISGLGGDDVLQGGSGSDTLSGGAGTDVVDYSEVPFNGVTVDITITTPQNVGLAGTDTLSGIEGVLGTNADDTFAFSNPADGAVYTVDGYGGFNTIDLSGFASSAVTEYFIGDLPLTVPLDIP